MSDEDPCAILAELKTARRQIITGGKPSMVRIKSGGGAERQVQYGAADLPALDREIATYQALCDRASGKRTRYAITAG